MLALTRRLTPEDRPKQFFVPTGGETLLNQTRRRVARTTLPEQTLLLLRQIHQHYDSRPALGCVRSVPLGVALPTQGTDWDATPDGKNVLVLTSVRSEEALKQEHEVLFPRNLLRRTAAQMPWGNRRCRR